eukprot:COSAG05_NODE_5945_length_1053_cov_1.318658_2_plen_89_part_01
MHADIGAGQLLNRCTELVDVKLEGCKQLTDAFAYRELMNQSAATAAAAVTAAAAAEEEEGSNGCSSTGGRDELFNLLEAVMRHGPWVPT